MTAPGSARPHGRARPHSRAVSVGRGVFAVVCGMFLVAGCAAFGFSFHSRPGQKRDDVFAATVLFAGTGAAMAVVALLVAIAPLVLGWWRPRWVLPATGLLALCLLRIAIATYTY